MKRLFGTQFDPKYHGEKGERNTSPSLTQPDQHLSIKELLTNHTRQNVNHLEGIYSEDLVVEQMDDITDHEERKEELKQQDEELKAQADQEQAEANAKKEAAAIQKAKDEIRKEEEEKQKKAKE